MGKPTGFLEYTRREDGRRPAAERIETGRGDFTFPCRRRSGASSAGCMSLALPSALAGMIYEEGALAVPAA